MKRGARRCWLALGVALTLPLGPASVRAQTPLEREIMSPRWMVEIKGGRFEPDLADFAQYYGGARTDYFAASFAYRFNHWLEAGAEVGHMRARGVGVLSSEGVPGGQVTYTLTPLHAFVNLRGELRAGQLLVPYLGFGATSAYYQQQIDLQADRDGLAELGAMVRIGVQLYLNRLDADTAGGYGDGVIKQSYLFIEAQRFTTEQSGSELGGDAYVIGFRFGFGRDISRP